MDLNTAHLGIGARVNHPEFGDGVVYGMDVSTVDIFFRGSGEKQISRNFDGLSVTASPRQVSQSLDLKGVEQALKKVLTELSDISNPVHIASKWEKGVLILKPSNSDLQSKEIPIETFFHKIVMLRDRLRVLEQNINSHEKLNETDKISLQQYISRAYGSLTTFNILFAEKADHFSSKSE